MNFIKVNHINREETDFYVNFEKIESFEVYFSRDSRGSEPELIINYLNGDNKTYLFENDGQLSNIILEVTKKDHPIE